MVKKTLRIGNMHCASCAMLIEGELEDRGVRARCSYARGTVDVEYDPLRVSNEEINNAIGRAGYTVMK
jgi:copper chaperone CopZ